MTVAPAPVLSPLTAATATLEHHVAGRPDLGIPPCPACSRGLTARVSPGAKPATIEEAHAARSAMCAAGLAFLEAVVRLRADELARAA